MREWWLRSPRDGGTTNFVYINSAGIDKNGGATESYYIAPAFCFGGTSEIDTDLSALGYVARKVKRAYIGVDGVARLSWTIGPRVFSTIIPLTERSATIVIDGLGFEPKFIAFQRLRSMSSSYTHGANLYAEKDSGYVAVTHKKGSSSAWMSFAETTNGVATSTGVTPNIIWGENGVTVDMGSADRFFEDMLGDGKRGMRVTVWGEATEGIYNEIFNQSENYTESLEFTNLGFEPKHLIVMHAKNRTSKDTSRHTLYNLYAEKGMHGFTVAFSHSSESNSLKALVATNPVEWGKDYVRIPSTYTWYDGGYTIPLGAKSYDYRVIILP
jgi:hypothetical protein